MKSFYSVSESILDTLTDQVRLVELDILQTASQTIRFGLSETSQRDGVQVLIQQKVAFRRLTDTFQFGDFIRIMSVKVFETIRIDEFEIDHQSVTNVMNGRMGTSR